MTINGFVSHYLENHWPFDGVNQSSMGSYHGYSDSVIWGIGVGCGLSYYGVSDILSTADDSAHAAQRQAPKMKMHPER